MRNPISLALLLLALCLGLFLLRHDALAHPGEQSESILLVANQRDQTLSFIDPDAAKQIAAVSEGGITGHEVATSPDGRSAYVPIYGNSGVGKPGTDGHNMVVIDIPTRKVIGNVDFGHGVRPHCVLYDRNSGMLYITTELDRSVTIVDPQTLKIAGAIPTTQAESHMLALSHDGRRGYTSNVGPGTISVLDMAARKTITVIPVSSAIQRIAISNDDSTVFTSDQSKPQLAVIDTSTNKVKSFVPLPAVGYGITPTSDGRSLLVAMQSMSSVALVDLATLKVARTIEVPRAPAEILMHPNRRVAYVSSPASHEVAVIDLAEWKVQKLIEAGNGADGLAWAGAPQHDR